MNDLRFFYLFFVSCHDTDVGGPTFFKFCLNKKPSGILKHEIISTRLFIRINIFTGALGLTFQFPCSHLELYDETIFAALD